MATNYVRSQIILINAIGFAVALAIWFISIGCSGILLSTPALAGALEDGQAAYDRGNFTSALSYWKELAETGNPDAMMRLSDLYLRGQGTNRDELEGLFWLERAANLDFSPAQSKLGQLYFFGNKRIRSNSIQAQYWIERAAEIGNTEAQRFLSSLYSSGWGAIPKDGVKSTYWMTKAANAGDVDAQIAVAQYYRIGQITQKNPQLSTYWFQKAAEQDSGDAEYWLAEAYALGFGVEKDESKANYWIRKSIAHGGMHELVGRNLATTLGLKLSP